MTKRARNQATSRRDFLTVASAACLAGMSGELKGAAQSQQQTITEFKDLRRNVGIFTGRGGTIAWFVSKDAVGVVDSMFPDMARVCLDGIAQRSGRRQVDFLMITHHHMDHTGGNSVFRPVTKRIVAHEKVPELQKLSASQQQPSEQAVYPDATFTHTWTCDLGKERAELKHYGPAHTGGDAVIHFHKADVVHMGDLVFNRRHPYIDKPAGATITGWIQVLESVAKEHNKNTIYIFGHAKQGWSVLGTKADLLFQRDYLAALLDFVKAGVREGKSQDLIEGATELLKGFPDHGPLIKRVLQAAYAELGG